jgi:parallel beta-helix repeat protein
MVLLLTTAVLFGLASPVLAFPDVPAGHPYEAAIEALSDAGIIGGYANGNFGLTDPVKRAQFAKMIVGTLGITLNTSTVTRFSDLGDPDSKGYPHVFVQTAFDNGITYGTNTEQTLFAPYNAIRRDQVVSMIVRGAKGLYPDLLKDPPAGTSSYFAGVSEPHGANLRIAQYNGLLDGLVGLGSTWSVTDTATRGEVAQMLYKLLQAVTAQGIWVYADGTGDYPTVDAAVAGVAEGATIHLGAGVFNLTQPVVVARHVRLVGMGLTEPHHTELLCSHEVLHVQGVQFAAEGIDFVSNGQNESIDVVNVTNGTVEFNNCRFAGAVRTQSGGKGCGLHLAGSTTANLTGCVLTLNDLNGLTVEPQAHVTANDCEISQNDQAGVCFYSSSTGTIQGGKMRSNGRFGICVQSNAQATIRDTECSFNATSNIAVYEDAIATVQHNVCSDSAGCGISFWGNSSGSVSDNECFRNGWGLYIQGTANPTVGTNNLHDNTYNSLDERT